MELKKAEKFKARTVDFRNCDRTGKGIPIPVGDFKPKMVRQFQTS